MTFEAQLGSAISDSPFSALEQFKDFPLYTPRQDLTRFLVRYELFKQVLGIHGSIVECGVFRGGGLMAWAHFSAIHEPFNHTRRIIGFDSFAGFPAVSQADGTGHEAGEMAAPGADAEIVKLAAIHDQNRPVGHISKVELVKGDATETIPAYVKANQHLLVALLYMDFDIHAPTETALKELLDRVPRGGIVAFDELNLKEWPGETLAFLDGPVFNCGRLQRMPWQSTVSYLVIE